LPIDGYPSPEFYTPGPNNALPPNTQGGSPVRELRPPGSVRGVFRNGYSYRNAAPQGLTELQNVRSSNLLLEQIKGKLNSVSSRLKIYEALKIGWTRIPSPTTFKV